MSRWDINITCPRCRYTGDVEVDIPCDHDEARRARAEVEALRMALERLASSEAFTVPMALGKGPLADEMRARLDFARSALASTTEGGETTYCSTHKGWHPNGLGPNCK